MGIRNNRYEALGADRHRPAAAARPVHADEALIARAHTERRLKFTLPGPMTICDTVADAHYGDRAAMAMAFAELLNEEARELAAIGVDVIQFDEPAFNVYLDEVVDWGIAALHRATEGLSSCKTAVHICYGYGIQANIDWKGTLGGRMAAVRADLPGAGGEPDRPGVARMRQFARADRAVGVCSPARTCWSARSTSRPIATRPRTRSPRRSSAALRFVPPERLFPCTNCGMAPLDRILASQKLAALTAGAALVRGRAA